jgi:hypothetical protein
MALRILRNPNPPGSAVAEYQLSRLDLTMTQFASPGGLRLRATAMGAPLIALDEIEEMAAALEVGQHFDVETGR